MSEEFRVDSPFGDSATVHCNIFVVLACAIVVDYFREKFLSDAAFAGNEHRLVEGRNGVGALHGIEQCPGIAYYRETLLYCVYFGIYIVVYFHSLIE